MTDIDIVINNLSVNYSIDDKTHRLTYKRGEGKIEVSLERDISTKEDGKITELKNIPLKELFVLLLQEIEKL